MEKKILLRKKHLKVGTIFKTVNRFKPNQYSIYRIEELDLKNDTAELSVLVDHEEHEYDATDKYYSGSGKTLFTYPSCHIKHNNTAWVDYYLPMGNVLYGTN